MPQTVVMMVYMAAVPQQQLKRKAPKAIPMQKETAKEQMLGWFGTAAHRLLQAVVVAASHRQRHRQLIALHASLTARRTRLRTLLLEGGSQPCLHI